jgi:hypothetical protein
VHAVAFAADGQTLASASEDGTVKFWDPAGGESLRTLRPSVRRLVERANGGVVAAGGSMWALAFSPGGHTLVGGGKGGTIWVWDPASGQARQTLAGHKGVVTALAFHPQGNDLISGGLDGAAYRWLPANAARPPVAMPPQEARAQPPIAAAPATPPQPVKERPSESPAQGSARGWFGAGLIIGLVLVLSVALGVWCYVRLSHAGDTLPVAEPVPDEPPPAPTAPPVCFPCSGCGKKLKAAAALAGRKVKCPQCGERAVVPAIQTGQPGRTPT